MSFDPDKTSAVTSFDVARRAGVSRSAVSRCFTPGASISAKSREKILKAASELGYRVNLVARGLNKQRTDLVGMIVSSLTTSYRAASVDALAKQLVQQGFRPMLFCIDEGKDVEQLLSILLNYQVSGVVITSDAPPAKICEECARMRVPLVMVHRMDDLPFVDLINGDDVKGARLAADALVEAGRKHLIVVEQGVLGYSGEVRVAAFRARAAELGVLCSTVAVNPVEYEAGVEAAAGVIAQLDKTPGVFCTTDTVALGLLDTLRNKHGVRIPEQMSLVGYDDIPESSWAFAELTTIKQSSKEFARVTVELLKERIKNPGAEPKNEIVDVQLVTRGTV